MNAIDDPNFQLMVDFYHLASEKEDPAIIVRAGAHIRHLHMANPDGPRLPAKLGGVRLRAVLRGAEQIGYDKRISVEASTKDLPADAPLAIALLRRAFR